MRKDLFIGLHSKLFNISIHGRSKILLLLRKWISGLGFYEVFMILSANEYLYRYRIETMKNISFFYSITPTDSLHDSTIQLIDDAQCTRKS